MFSLFGWRLKNLYLFSRKYHFVKLILVLALLYAPVGKGVQLISAVNPFVQGHLSDVGFVAWFPAFHFLFSSGHYLNGEISVSKGILGMYGMAAFGLILGIFSEFLQFTHLMPGEGDYLDMVAFVISFALTAAFIKGLSVEAKTKENKKLRYDGEAAGA